MKLYMKGFVSFIEKKSNWIWIRVDVGLATGRPGRPTWPSQIGDFGFGLAGTWPS